MEFLLRALKILEVLSNFPELFDMNDLLITSSLGPLEEIWPPTNASSPASRAKDVGRNLQ